MAQLGIKNKRIAQVLILFLLFFILSTPQTAGPQARDFFAWVGDQAEAAGTFFDGLFSEDQINSNGPVPSNPMGHAFDRPVLNT